MKTVYLAGPIIGLSYASCNDWREYAKFRLKEYGIVGVSPMRGKESLSLEENSSDKDKTGFLVRKVLKQEIGSTALLVISC